ncbi:DNA-binding response regulator [Parashewanella curva]|uniref:DNA-binding response regulator n=1 Tax=Parashewanella curva TaxID=2338552 RepID=A0A3L8PTG7_9GAMM|nr:response regulator transcription factor [Parashewanella curva]RLV58584.1 DNA-binding response regulator [Parashewanella curva]
MMASSYSCILVDDHPLFRQALSAVLVQKLSDEQSDIAVHEAESIAELSIKLKTSQPDLILLDLNLPDSQGFETLISLKFDYPAIAVVVISGQEDASTVKQAVQLGASGFLPKSTSVEQMVLALKDVLNGKIWLPEQYQSPEPCASKLTNLTPRQHKILAMFAKGMLNKQVAFELGLSEATVKAHATAIYQKLGVNTRTQAVIIMQNELGITA